MNPILQRLLDIMSEKGITAKKVTEDCNMSASSFTDWKKGKASPGVEAIAKLSDYFHVSTDYLIKGVEFEGDPKPADDSEAEVQATVQAANFMEFSNPVETELLAKFRRLPPECQGKAFSYIDGMLAVLPLSVETEEDVRSIG